MNPEQEISSLEELLDQLIAGIQQIVESGEELSDEFQGMLASEISETMNRIDQLESELGGIEKEAQIQTPVSDNANLLWILSGGQPEDFVSYLQEFPDPSFANLLSNPNLLNSTIQQLQKTNPIDRVGIADGIPQASLQSSNVYGFRFNPRSKKLQVRFQGGSLYEYDNVPDQIFSLFSSGNAQAKTDGRNRYGKWWRGKKPSLGASLNQYIKQGGYNYRKLR